MNCESNVEKLVECARRRGEPETALKAHLRICGNCLDRWEAERDLSENLRIMRSESGALRSSAAARQSLMREFDARHRRSAAPSWYWGLAAAAALLLGILLGPEAMTRLHPAAAVVATDTSDTSASAGDQDSEGFIAVPYAPPLAPGENLRIVHTELNPAALANLGVSVDPSWTTQLPADVLEGEDGMPRAVRVSEGDSGESGF